MVFSVDLSFTGDKSLLNNVDFILTFDQQSMKGMYTIYNPVVWRVTSFPKGGGGIFKATYNADLAFTRAQINDGIVQSAAYSTHIDVGEQTTLTMDGTIDPPTFSFSKPVNWSGAGPGEFQCHNQTGNFQNIGVGFYEKGHTQPITSVVLNNVPNNAVAATFTPTLSAYVISNFVENQIIKAQIQSNIGGWTLNLADPGIQKDWVLQESKDGYTLIAGSPPA